MQVKGQESHAETESDRYMEDIWNGTKVEKIVRMRYGEIKALYKITTLYKVLSLIKTSPVHAAKLRIYQYKITKNVQRLADCVGGFMP